MKVVTVCRLVGVKARRRIGGMHRYLWSIHVLQAVDERWRTVEVCGDPVWAHYATTATNQRMKQLTKILLEKKLKYIEGLRPGMRTNFSDVERLAFSLSELRYE